MSGRQSAQVIVIAHATLYRAGWTALLANQPDITLTGAVDAAAAVTPYLNSGSPATLLIDFPPPLLSLIQHLHTSYPAAGLLALVDNYDLDLLLPLLRAGATGCISRDESVADLARAIIAVGRGEIWLPPAVAGRALAALARGQTPGGDDLIEPLTERETDVLRLLA
ncbi:MAG: response regulator transcription factor, partial [Anaerolineae bacterium]|nr:response regulator transcription factor [Anaerolineae bacterium]